MRQETGTGSTSCVERRRQTSLLRMSNVNAMLTAPKTLFLIPSYKHFYDYTLMYDTDSKVIFETIFVRFEFDLPKVDNTY